MATCKSDINESYQELLRQLVNAKEQMQDFLEMVEELQSEHRFKPSPENRMKSAANNMRMSLYGRIKDFLEDMTLSCNSSEIQNAIDDLPDEEWDCCSDCGAEFTGYHHCEVAQNNDIEE